MKWKSLKAKELKPEMILTPQHCRYKDDGLRMRLVKKLSYYKWLARMFFVHPNTSKIRLTEDEVCGPVSKNDENYNHRNCQWIRVTR